MARSLLTSLLLSPGLALLLSASAPAQLDLPADVQPACVVDKGEFATWSSGRKFVPANGLTFSDAKGASFYKWSWQMFLWLTDGNQKGLVFESAPFWDFDHHSGNFIADPVIRVRDRKLENIDELNEADNHVLMSQSGSLVYYGQHANDVLRWAARGHHDGALKSKRFPTSQQDLDKLETYLKGINVSLNQQTKQALAIEMKSAWIEIDPKSAKASRYLTIPGTVPEFTRTSGQWSVTGKTRKVRLALVGLHIVGTMKGHPEFNWATFEHIDNAPDGNYYYFDTNGKMVEHRSFDGSGTYTGSGKNWSFYDGKTPLAAANSTKTASQWVRTKGQPDGIKPAPKPNAAVRLDPWGTRRGSKDKSAVLNNTELISLNRSIHGLLGAGELRANYVLIGAIWTDGKLPATNKKGCLTLANTTMETFLQGTNCFTCHDAGNGLSVSHMFNAYRGN